MFLEESQKRTPGVSHEVIITLPETAVNALNGETGTKNNIVIQPEHTILIIKMRLSVLSLQDSGQNP